MDIPTILPTGETIWMDHEFIKMLHEGKPEVGWVGDPRLMPYFGNDCIELRRRDDQGNMRLVAKSKPGVRHLDMQLIVWLAEHDPQSRRGYDLYNDIKQHNEKAQAKLDASKADRNGEAIERLAHALMKDVGAYENGSTRRFYQGVDIPKGKK